MVTVPATRNSLPTLQSAEECYRNIYDRPNQLLPELWSKGTVTFWKPSMFFLLKSRDAIRIKAKMFLICLVSRSVYVCCTILTAADGFLQRRNKVYSKILSLKPPNLIYTVSRSPAEMLKASGLTKVTIKSESKSGNVSLWFVDLLVFFGRFERKQIYL